MNRKNLKFHIEVNDYFGTLATLLNLLSDSIGVDRFWRRDKRIMKELVDDLVYLQKHYWIVQNAPMISKEALEEFKAIWKKQFGTEISDAEALESATKLLTLVKAVYKPIKQEWIDELKKKKEKS